MLPYQRKTIPESRQQVARVSPASRPAPGPDSAAPEQSLKIKMVKSFSGCEAAVCAASGGYSRGDAKRGCGSSGCCQQVQRPLEDAAEPPGWSAGGRAVVWTSSRPPASKPPPAPFRFLQVMKLDRKANQGTHAGLTAKAEEAEEGLGQGGC